MSGEHPGCWCLCHENGKKCPYPDVLARAIDAEGKLEALGETVKRVEALIPPYEQVIATRELSLTTEAALQEVVRRIRAALSEKKDP